MLFRWILGCGALSAAQVWKPQKKVDLLARSLVEFGVISR